MKSEFHCDRVLVRIPRDAECSFEVTTMITQTRYANGLFSQEAFKAMCSNHPPTSRMTVGGEGSNCLEVEARNQWGLFGLTIDG